MVTSLPPRTPLRQARGGPHKYQPDIGACSDARLGSAWAAVWGGSKLRHLLQEASSRRIRSSSRRIRGPRGEFEPPRGVFEAPRGIFEVLEANSRLREPPRGEFEGMRGEFEAPRGEFDQVRSSSIKLEGVRGEFEATASSSSLREANSKLLEALRG